MNLYEIQYNMLKTSIDMTNFHDDFHIDEIWIAKLLEYITTKPLHANFQFVLFEFICVVDAYLFDAITCG